MVNNEINMITWSVASQQNDISHPSPDAPTSKTLFNIALVKLPLFTGKAVVHKGDRDYCTTYPSRKGYTILLCKIDHEASGYVIGSAHAYDVVYSREDTDMRDDIDTAPVESQQQAGIAYRWVQVLTTSLW